MPRAAHIWILANLFCLEILSACASASGIDLSSFPTAVRKVYPPKSAVIFTPTPTPVTITATVWEQEPVAPMLVYHKFKTNNPSTFTAVSRVDFQYHLETLYESGFVTIPVEKWLAGDIRVPEGKRPIILSMDDLFYRNQILLDANGEPEINTGLGYAWDFYNTHPDFGYNWALFSNLGDKPYGTGTYAEQEIQLANVIVWCLENNAIVYNHTFRHANLKNTNGLGITAELSSNDKYLSHLLELVGRTDLQPKIANMISIPGGRWPLIPDGQTALFGYKNPRGTKVQAIFNVDFITRPDFIPPPYADSFNAMNLPRMVATNSAIDYVARHTDEIPFAGSCTFNVPNQSMANNAEYLENKILEMTATRQCVEGIYATGNFIFAVKDGNANLLHPIKIE